MRRTLGGLGIVLLAGLGLLAALVLALDLGWQRERLIALAAGLAEEQLGVPVSVGGSGGRLRRGIELTDVRVGEPSAPLARIGAVRIRWSLRSLVSRGPWTIHAIRVRDWSLRLDRSTDGRWTTLEDLVARWSPESDDASDPLEATGEVPSTLDLLVRRIVLEKGEISVTLAPPIDPDALAAIQPGVPARIRIRTDASLDGLRIEPDEPLYLETAELTASLIEVDSGRPAFDRTVRGELVLLLRDRAMEAFRVELQGSGFDAQLEGAGTLERLDRVRATADIADLEPFRGWLPEVDPLAGAVSLHADLSGPLRALTGRVRIDASDLSVQDVRARTIDLALDLTGSIQDAWDDPASVDATLSVRAKGLDPGALDRGLLPDAAADLDLDGTLRDGILAIERGRLRLAGLEAQVQGRLSTERIEELSVDLSVEDVSPWLRRARPDLALRGPLQGKARLSGSPPWLRGEVSLESQGLELAGRPLGALVLDLERKADQPASVALSLGPRGRRDLELRAHLDPDRERADFVASGEAGTWACMLESAPAMKGRFEVEGFVERWGTAPRFDVALRSSATEIDGRVLGDIEISARRTADVDRLELTHLVVDGALGRLDLEAPAVVRLGSGERWILESTRARVTPALDSQDAGHAVLTADGRATRIDELAIRLEQLPVALVNLLRPDEPALSGRIDGRVHWRRVREPGWTAGELEWQDPAIGDAALPRIEMRWTAEASSITVALDTAEVLGEPLRVRGQVDLPDADTPLAELWARAPIRVEAELDRWRLAGLSVFAPGWLRQPSGRLSGSIVAGRDGSGLFVRGDALVEEGGFAVPLLRRRFAPIDARLSFDDRSVSVTSLRVGGDEPTLQASGSFELDKPSTLEARVELDRFALSRSSALWLDVLGDVRVSGTLDQPVIRGRLEIADGRLGVPGADDPILKEIRIASRSRNGSLVEEVDATEGVFEGAEIDLVLEVPETTRVRGQGANLFVEGEARLRKEPGEPARVLGEARVVGGTYTFQGRRFRVRRGRVLFTGDERLDPVLDFEARLPVSDIVAIVEVSGRLSSPVVQLASDPPRSSQDVLSYLLFGRPADDVGVAGSSNFGAAAARLVAGVAEQELREVLGDAMPVDTIEIGADQEGNTSEIGVGKYIRPDLYLRYVRVLGDEPADRVDVEYRLNDLFSIGSSVSTTGNTGLDLILRHDF